jgi:ubiquinone/menaquinone biosynthesis C-methylase UbiE
MSKVDTISIKEKILQIDPKRWWGDDFDVRFFLISKLNKINKKIILDVGGGIGIISGELNNDNIKINLDRSISDLKKCKIHTPEINNICASITHLPIKENSIDVVIGASVLEYAKSYDLKNNYQIKKKSTTIYPSIEKTLSNIYQSLKKDGKFFLTTPNNKYYKTEKIDYFELKESISNNFNNFQIFFFNTHKVINKKYPKLNLTNVIPKLKSKIENREKILNSLLKKDEGQNIHSVSFFVEGTK